MLEIELKSVCNERCGYFYVPHEEKKYMLSSEKAFKAIDELEEMGALSIILGGGEPLMHPDFEKIFRYAAEKDFRIILLSNLTLLNNRHIELFKECGLGYVQTSLYSMDTETHDKITNLPGSNLLTIEAAKKLYENDIKIKVSCPILDINAGNFIDVLHWAKKMNIIENAYYNIFAESNLCTENLKHRLPISEAERILEQIISFEKEKNLENDKIPGKRYSNDPVCGVGTFALCLSAKGDYYPCSGWQGYVVGNINQKLREIWENSPALKKVRSIKWSSFPRCMECEAQKYCLMCLVKNYNENGGDMHSQCEYFCEEAFLKKKLFEKFNFSG